MTEAGNNLPPPRSASYTMRKKIVFDNGQAKRKKQPEKSKTEKGESRAKYNAATTGVYAAGLLPWEGEELWKNHVLEFVKFYRPVGYVEHGVVTDMAANRWQRRRTRQMMAVATLRHGFGLALVEAEPQSWIEVRSFLSESDLENKQMLKDMRASIAEVHEMGEQLKVNFDSDAVSKFLQELADTCAKNCELLDAIKSKLDLEDDFFQHYLPKNSEQIVRVETALDAQFDKMHSRLQVIQEARLRRDALLLQKQQAATVALLGNQQGPEIHSLDEAESDVPRSHQTDEGDWPGRHPNPETNFDADDPLRMFVEQQQGDGSNPTAG